MSTSSPPPNWKDTLDGALTDAGVSPAVAAAQAAAVAPPVKGGRKAETPDQIRDRVGPVFWWADGSAEQITTAVTWLVRFVEWLIATYQIAAIPPCWLAHPRLVYELWALERFLHVTHAPDHLLNGPVMWTAELDRVISRLETRWKVTCTSDQHHPDPDDVDWRTRRATYRQLAPAALDDTVLAWAWPEGPLDIDIAPRATVPAQPGSSGIESSWEPL